MEHERYERLVVGHVLGDLDAPDAGRFSEHLMACAHCRSRVAELRRIETELSEIERDAVLDLSGDLDDDLDAVAPGPIAGNRIGVRHVTIAAIVVVLLAAVMGFWNLHLRTNLSVMATAAEQRGEVLDGFATSQLVDTTTSADVAALVAHDTETLAVTVVPSTSMPEGEYFVLWLTEADGTVLEAHLLAQALDDETFSLRVDDPGADALTISRESGVPALQEPSDAVVVEAHW